MSPRTSKVGLQICRSTCLMQPVPLKEFRHPSMQALCCLPQVTLTEACHMSLRLWS